MGCVRGGMHKVLFGLKRAFQSALEWAKVVYAPIGLTPARFDMMVALYQDEYMAQSGLRRVLGVSGATISRMLKSLRALGWVESFPDEDDRRRRFVALTERGEAVFKAARRHVIGDGVGELAIESVIEHSWPGKAPGRAILNLMIPLACIRRGFGDLATLHYGTGPGD